MIIRSAPCCRTAPAAFSTRARRLVAHAASSLQQRGSLEGDAALAELSSLCYVRDGGELRRQLKAAKLDLVAEGSTYFTRYIVAESPEHQRFICLRGVSWAAPTSAGALRVWRDLANMSPAPFLRHLAQPSVQLVAHTGVAGMAAALWEELRPHISAYHGDIQVAGHSLGGSLAILLAGHASLRLGIGERVYCSSFGSPPVLALDNGPGGSDIPAALGMPGANCRNFVCNEDLVPRMFEATDPAFMTLQSLPGMSTLLGLRERLLGASASFSTTRFLYHAAGPVFLLRWDGERAFAATPVDPGEAHKQLALEGGRTALQLARSILDHHCGSYSQALRSASAAASLALQQRNPAA